MIAEKQLFDPARALEERTAAVDTLVLGAWEKHFAPTAAAAALLAVGGYGRRQLFPYSDVDVLLLFADEKTAVAFEQYLKSGSGKAFLKRHLLPKHVTQIS